MEIRMVFGLKVGKYSAGIVIHIAVPEQFEKIKVKSISGDIKANNSNAKILLIHTGAGLGVEGAALGTGLVEMLAASR